MASLAAPSVLFAICALFVVTMLAKRHDAHRTGIWVVVAATAIVIAIAGAGFMTNWLAFIDPPDYCWKARKTGIALMQRALAWEDCRMQITLAAISLDAMIAVAMAMSLMPRRNTGGH